MSKTMSELINDVKAAERRLIKSVQPLNKRLADLDMHVYWEGYYQEWFINRFANNDRSGMSFWLDGRKYNRLMAMSDEQLLEYCANWGKS